MKRFCTYKGKEFRSMSYLVESSSQVLLDSALFIGTTKLLNFPIAYTILLNV